MTNKRKNIPNPSALSAKEIDFIKSASSSNIPLAVAKKPVFKGRMISMSDDFFNELNKFLQKNPTEGSRSSFIVRVVAKYIKNKNNTF